MAELEVYSEGSGDHRNGPMSVPGKQYGPWGVRWEPHLPEPWPGFKESVSDCDYVFVHRPVDERPTNSHGRGSWSYWKEGRVAGIEVHLDIREEEGSYGELIRTIHVAPKGPNPELTASLDAWVDELVKMDYNRHSGY